MIFMTAEFQTAWVPKRPSLVNTPSCHVNTGVSMNCFCFKNNKLRDKNQRYQQEQPLRNMSQAKKLEHSLLGAPQQTGKETAEDANKDKSKKEYHKQYWQLLCIDFKLHLLKHFKNLHVKSHLTTRLQFTW